METGKTGGPAAAAVPAQDPKQPQQQAATPQSTALQARGSSSTCVAAPRNPPPGSAPTPVLLAQAVTAQSLQLLEAFAEMAQADTAAVASAVLKAIRQGNLRQRPTQPKFGGQLTLADGRKGIAVVVVLQPVAQLELQSLSFQFSEAPDHRIDIGLTLSDSVQTQVDHCLRRLLAWERGNAHTLIKAKLLTLPDADRPLAIRYLDSIVAGKTQAEMPDAIADWTVLAEPQNTLPGSDTRTAMRRELEDSEEAAMRDPEYAQLREEVCALFLHADRISLQLVSVQAQPQKITYRSVLSRRVMADPRGPLASIRDIHAILQNTAQPRRRSELHDWHPRTAEMRLKGARQIPAFNETEAKILV